MGIPNEIKIGILGAGGKMGMRISANLKKLRNEIFFIENAEIGIKRLEESGLKVSAPAEAMDQLDVLILAVPDILINKISTQVVPNLKADSTVILLDPAAAYMNQLSAPDTKEIGMMISQVSLAFQNSSFVGVVQF